MSIEKRYLLACTKEELVEILLSVPEIKNQVYKRFKLNDIDVLSKQIPDHILTGYYLEEFYGEYSKALKVYILKHFEGADIHLLLKHYNIVDLPLQTYLKS